MKRIWKYFCIAIGAIAVAFAILWLSGGIGVCASNVERDARSLQKIPEDWAVEKEIGEEIAAMVFYDEAGGDDTFSVYVKHSGLSLGYFFRGGGSDSWIDREIAKFQIEGKSEIAYISMNSRQVVKVEIDDGNGVEVVKLDERRPFVLVLPVNHGDVAFYDINGERVDAVLRSL